MKGVSKIVRYYFTFSMVLLLLMCLSGCNGVSPTLPVINSFTVSPPIIDAGDSAVLSWEVTNATSINIIPGDMTFTSLSSSVAVFPDTATNYTLTATNAEGSVSSSVAINVTPIEPAEQIITIQPGPVEGIDSLISDGTPFSNWGYSDHVSIGNNLSYDQEFRACLKFDLSDLTSDTIIVNALLKLYQYETLGSLVNFMIGLYRTTENWEETAITWDNQPTCYSIPESTFVITAEETAWLSWDITPLLQGWVDGSIINQGVFLKEMNEGLVKTYIKCYSSDYNIDPSLRPKLEITYYLP